MQYLEQEKKKQHIFEFLITYSGVFIFSLLFSIIFCLGIHIKYYEEYPTSILWTLFLFVTPALIVMAIILITYYFIFKKVYLDRKFFSHLKEFLSYLSVFSLIIINSLVKFYIPLEGDEESELWILREIEEFFKITIEDVNYTYTLPVVFSISTIIMYLFENWNHATQSTYKKKVKIVKPKKVVITPIMERSQQIIKEMEDIVEESKETLTKYRKYL